MPSTIFGHRAHLDRVIHVRHELDLLQPLLSADFGGPLPLVRFFRVEASLHISSLSRASIHS